MGQGQGIPSDSDQLSDGTTYYYLVTAVDDTSPSPNESTSSRILSEKPLDLTPPGEVKNLVSKYDGQVVSLTWESPTDLDYAGVVIVRNDNKPVGAGSLGSASAAPPFNHGPEYFAGSEPFGPGNGRVVYTSLPDENPRQFDDCNVESDRTYYYKIFTYDRAVNGPPREMGRNYSSGVTISQSYNCEHSNKQ